MDKWEEYRQYLIELLTEARTFGKRCTTQISKAYINAKIEALEMMLVFISKSIKEGEINMEKARSEVKIIDEGTFESVARARKESPVTSKIIRYAKELKPSGYKKVDPELIDPVHFHTRVHNLKASGAIPEDVKPKNVLIIDGQEVRGLFLVKLNKEQMRAEPVRNRRNKATTN